MTRAVVIDPTDPAPIWRQIEEGVRRLVAAGALPAGALAPSVRDLARELRVNPATVAKAYQRLVDGGVLVVRRGAGTYVADPAPRFSGDERRRRVAEAAARFAALALAVGADRASAVDELRAAWDALAGDGEEVAR